MDIYRVYFDVKNLRVLNIRYKYFGYATTCNTIGYSLITFCCFIFGHVVHVSIQKLEACEMYLIYCISCIDIVYNCTVQ